MSRAGNLELFFLNLFISFHPREYIAAGRWCARSRAHRASGSSRSSHAVGRAAPNGTVLPLRR